ncbi:hypothetical protein EFS38_14215 [Dickeya undicola]|uniref:Uncharacterized protein n=1 Tax=Dickeya undicola TaxID=1577887 RepID=A0A3N0FZG8_9GAMM|nr:hypothetical protein EF878_12785 [Dickeya undicola]RNM22076.1 hypothetical protein EFS38_14215 [Dickeya undicola]
MIINHLLFFLFNAFATGWSARCYFILDSR